MDKLTVFEMLVSPTDYGCRYRVIRYSGARTYVNKYNTAVRGGRGVFSLWENETPL